MAGVNSSAAVTVLTLKKYFGLSIRPSIAYLRDVRSECVPFNKTFENYLLNWED
jgi:hypothetical protein